MWVLCDTFPLDVLQFSCNVTNEWITEASIRRSSWRGRRSNHQKISVKSLEIGTRLAAKFDDDPNAIKNKNK